jgi:hypothetical protein
MELEEFCFIILANKALKAPPSCSNFSESLYAIVISKHLFFNTFENQLYTNTDQP